MPDGSSGLSWDLAAVGLASLRQLGCLAGYGCMPAPECAAIACASWLANMVRLHS